MRRTLLVIPCLFAMLILTACDRGGDVDPKVKAFLQTHPATHFDPADVSEDKTVSIITADRPGTLDPHETQNGGDTKIIRQVYQTLLSIDPKNADVLVPELATKWSIADDNLAVEFELRDGVTFHDGAKLDAAAVKLSLDRLRGKYLDVPAAPYRPFYDFIESVEAEGMTVTVYLSRPVPRIALRNLAMFPASIISPALLAATEDMETNERSAFIADHASGTGAFYLYSFDKASAHTRLHAFEDYRDGKSKVDALVFRQVADASARVEQLRSGTAQLVDDVPRAVWDEVEQGDQATLYKWWAMNICYMALNVQHEKTKDINLRRAIQLAVDRDSVIELYYGTARPTYSLVAQTLGEYAPAYRVPGGDEPLAARQAKARTLIEQSGIGDTKLTLYYPQDDRPYLPTPSKVADKLRQQLEAVGLNVTPLAVPNAEYFDSIHKGKYELALVGWMSDNADPDNFYTPLADGSDDGTPASTNAARAFDQQVHDALVKAQQLTSTDERKAAYRAVEKRLQEQVAGYVPLVNTQQGMAFDKSLTGVEVDPLGYYRFHKAALK